MSESRAVPRVGAILIQARDPARLAGFYHRGLGLPAPEPAGGIVGIRAANTYLGFEALTTADPDHRPRTTVWFEVPDVRAAFARLLAEGGRPSMEPDATCSPGETLAVCEDPEGNRVGLVGPEERNPASKEGRS